MHHFLTVSDVLRAFPARKKSWAYQQMKDARPEGSKIDITSVADLAIWLEIPEVELRRMLGPEFESPEK